MLGETVLFVITWLTIWWMRELRIGIRDGNAL